MRINVIYPPSVTWDGKKQRPYHLLKQLALRGMHVYYIDTAKNRPERKFEKIFERFYYCSENGVAVKELKKPENQGINIYYAQYPDAMYHARHFKIDLLWYDYLDDFPHRRKGEAKIIHDADVVSASGEWLFKKAKEVRSQVEMIQNGCDYEHFRQAEKRMNCPELDGITQPIIGYHGALASWWDLPLMDYVVDNFSFARFVFVGNQYDTGWRKPHRLKDRLDNVILVGTKDYEDLPNYLSRFNACIIPFDTKNEIIRATNPIKLYEYFASGKPVVTTDMFEVRKYNSLISASSDPRVFVKNLAESLNNKEGENIKKRRQEVAKENDWTVKGEQLYNLLINGLHNRNKIDVTPNFKPIKSSKPLRILFPSRKYAARNLSHALNKLPNVESIWCPELHGRQILSYIKETFTKYIEDFKPDIVFWEGMCIPIWNPNVIKIFAELKEKYKFRLVYWSTEDPPHHKNVGKPRSEISDYVFCTAEEFVPVYEGYGKPSSTLLFAANTDVHKPRQVEPQFKCDISYIGNNYNHQNKIKGMKMMFLPLIERNYNFKIWGIWWVGENPYLKNEILIPPPTWQGALSYRHVSWAYSSAKINLGLQVDNDSITHTPFRPYEILGSGGFHISQYSKSMENIFNGLVELVNSEEEFLEKVDYYLRNEDARLKRAEEGRQFILSHHTYDKRARKVLKDLKKGGII